MDNALLHTVLLPCLEGGKVLSSVGSLGRDGGELYGCGGGGGDGNGEMGGSEGYGGSGEWVIVAVVVLVFVGCVGEGIMMMVVVVMVVGYSIAYRSL